MAIREKFQDEESFKCEECGFHYKEEDLAEKCETFCREKGICNSKIAKKALERN